MGPAGAGGIGPALPAHGSLGSPELRTWRRSLCSTWDAAWSSDQLQSCSAAGLPGVPTAPPPPASAAACAGSPLLASQPSPRRRLAGLRSSASLSLSLELLLSLPLLPLLEELLLLLLLLLLLVPDLSLPAAASSSAGDRSGTACR